MTDERTGTAPRDLFRWLYLGGLAITGIGMPWGEFLMSIGRSSRSVVGRSRVSSVSRSVHA